MSLLGKKIRFLWLKVTNQINLFFSKTVLLALSTSCLNPTKVGVRVPLCI